MSEASTKTPVFPISDTLDGTVRADDMENLRAVLSALFVDASINTFVDAAGQEFTLEWDFRLIPVHHDSVPS